MAFLCRAPRGMLWLTVLALLASLVCTGQQADAQFNVALGKPIIDGSGSWDGDVVGVGQPFNGGTFPGGKIVDGNTSEPGGDPATFWLGREQTLNEYLTLDLREAFEIEGVALYNTHNREYDDRATDEFVLWGSLDVDETNQLIDPFPIASGNLSDVRGQADIEPDYFSPEAPVTARYLRFEALTYLEGLRSVGLNEIEVFADVEPPNNLALGKPVIDGSGSWDGGEQGVGAPFDGGNFPATNVTDGSFADLNTGPPNTYWLGREYTESEYFTLDLGDVFTVEEINLRNTHNTQYNDRGTDEFVLFGSTEVDGNNELVDPIVLLSGNLSDVSGQSPIQADVFTEENGLDVADVRYLRFEALTYLSSDTNGSSGLNEIEVYGRLPGGVTGDFNGDGDFDTLDIDLLVAEIIADTNDSAFDMTSDGLVNQDDLTLWRTEGAAANGLAPAYLEGDANLDGRVDAGDLNALALSWQGSPNTWTGGDFDASGQTNAGDLNSLAINWQQAIAPLATAVPEPSTVILIGVVGLFALLRRR